MVGIEILVQLTSLGTLPLEDRWADDKRGHRRLLIAECVI
jgi:hypothetical protein